MSLKNTWWKAVILSVIAISSWGFAAGAALADEFNVYAHMESFVWKEFEGTTQLLKESGPLAGVGFTYHGDIGGEGAALTLTPRIELFGGTVDYDGQTMDGVPVTSDTDYFGFKLEFDIGGQFGKGFSVEPFGGIGIRNWWRDINDSIDVTGRPVSGYTEYWNIMYGRVGLRGGVDFSKESRMFFEVVGRIPIYNENTAYMSDVAYYYEDVTMKPGKVGTLFAELGFKLHAFKASAYYEALRFSESKIVYQNNPYFTKPLQSWQPRSEADMFGIRIGAAF